MEKITAIVLGGGLSTRMGQDKTLLTINGETLMARTVKKLRAISDDIIIAGNSKNKYGIEATREVEDTFNNCGPLGGIHAALTAARYETAFVCAGDLPYFDAAIVTILRPYLTNDYQMVMPAIEGRGEPLCALYRRDCRHHLAAMAERGNYKPYHLAKEVKSVIVPETTLRESGIDLALFFNMNTPADYEQVDRTIGVTRG